MSQIDLTQYKWFEYQEGQPVLTYDQPRHNEDYELEIHGGNVYGVKKRAHGIFVIHKHSPDILFTLNDQELVRLMQHSKGWSGKIKRVQVQAGVGDLDKTGGVALPKGWLRIEDMNSSNLHFAIYDSKRKILYVAFHNGDSWAYENVSMREYKDMVAAESRGRYFNYLIKYVKAQYQIGRNFDLPPFDVAPTGPRKEAVAPKPKEGKTLKELEASAPKTPTTPEPEKAPEKPGHAKRALHIPKGAFHVWLDTEQVSTNANTPGSAFEILRRQRVDSEAELFKLLASLRFSTFIRADHRAFKSAVMSVVALGDEYPLTTRGKATYKTLRAHVIALGKRPASDFM